MQAPLFDLHENLQAPLFDLHAIYRLLYSIYMTFTGSFIRFTLYLQAPLFDLHEKLQAPLFDLHDIYSLLYSIYRKIYRPLYLIYMLFTGSFIRFT